MSDFKFVKIRNLKKFFITRYVWTSERKLIKKHISENGFDNLNYYITITKDYYVIDGNHRLYTLLDKFDDDYLVKVKTENISILQLIFLMTMFYILIFPIMIVKFIKLEIDIKKNRIQNEFKRNRKRNKRDIR